jgi:aminopeptidase-like protein
MVGQTNRMGMPSASDDSKAAWSVREAPNPDGHNTCVTLRDSIRGLGPRLYDLCREMYPICRSITGDGVRATLDVIGREIPLARAEVPSGTQAFDWTVPPEWNIRDAYVLDAAGDRVIDFNRSNLHVMSYSVPVDELLTLDELSPHLLTMPDRPALVPYRTSYYEEGWAFCMADDARAALAQGTYRAVIDSTLEPGALSYGECVIPGSSSDEVVISCHVCHPSLANDNLSGIAVVTHLARALAARDLRYSYRLLFIPGTIGSIVWLSQHEDVVRNIRHGLVVAGVGDRAPFTYKRSRRGSAEVDRAMVHTLRALPDHRIVDFTPYGYDERQFCSPGFNLPFGRLSRSVHGEHPEYHTSADNLDFVTEAQLEQSLETIASMVDVLEGNRRYRNLQPHCEPQLGRRGLYRAVGGAVDSRSVEIGMLWVLNLSDGTADLLEIADRAGLPFASIRAAADALVSHGLLAPVEAEG